MNRLPRAYADTSVLVKRYVRESGSALAAKITADHAIVISALAPVEVTSALHARYREGTLTARQLSAALARVAEDRLWWDLIEVVPAVLSRAEEVIRRAPTRAVDAIHIASLLFLQEATGERYVFLTADEKQRRSAQAAGLAVRWVGTA